MEKPVVAQRRTFVNPTTIRLAAPLALTLALASCALFKKEETARACPRLGIVADAAEMTQYRPGAGRDITDQLFTAKLADVSGSCRFDKASANVEMKVSIIAERGAAMREPGSEVEYFVAVTGPQDEILAKENFRTRLDFGARNRTGSGEELTQRIPLPGSADPGTYAVLVGFQLSPEELAENRRRRGFR
jgi:hypothetical protein